MTQKSQDSMDPSPLPYAYNQPHSPRKTAQNLVICYRFCGRRQSPPTAFLLCSLRLPPAQRLQSPYPSSDRLVSPSRSPSAS